jgi:hypothetical protein
LVSKAKRIFSKRAYEKDGIKQRLQDGNREWITTIGCICADGTSLSPGLIYQAASGNIQDTWLQDFNEEEHRCFFASSKTGWTNDELGFAWLRDVFDRETKEKARRRWRLLIMDSHGSHLTPTFLDFCLTNKIYVATFPPHSTHSLQPLDVGIFSPLSRAYSDQLEGFLHACQGLSSITKRDFFRLFWPAWGKALSVQNINSAWKSTGLAPFDPEVVLKKFSKKEDQRPSSSSSAQSVLHADDWRQIERLLRKVVVEVSDEKTKKLSSTIHHLTTENILLKLHCKGLESALINEKRKRQRGKPLDFGFRAPEHGYAVFYSPKKIQQARGILKEKEEAIQNAKAAREEEKAQRKLRKEENERIKELKRRERVSQRELRIQLEEEKRQQKEEDRLAKEAAKQLQTDIKTTRSTTKKASKKSPVKKKQAVEPIVPQEVEDPSPPVNSRGRQIRLPQRFRIE